MSDDASRMSDEGAAKVPRRFEFLATLRTQLRQARRAGAGEAQSRRARGPHPDRLDRDRHL